MDQAINLQQRPNITAQEKRALLALWAVPGVGTRQLDLIRGLADGDLGKLLELDPAEWLGAPGIRGDVRAQLTRARVRSLEQVAATVERRAQKGEMKIAWQSDPEYPERLLEVADAPPVLFYRGELGVPRRRVAMVGSRRVEPGFLDFTQRFARELARLGLGIVSGGAVGIDRASHLGALEAAGETWAFFGSALDALDAAQRRLAPQIVHGGGMVFSELPPGVRASVNTFPRRNRLISGASDAVLVARAGLPSGALHTARSAMEQGRTLLAFPADPDNVEALGTNHLLHERWARAVFEPGQVAREVGLAAAAPAEEQPSEQPVAPSVRRASVLDELSEPARSTYLALPRAPRTFEEVLSGSTLEAGALVSALCELELVGLVLQKPGKVYEKV